MTVFTFKTKPRDEQASFNTECYRCGNDITVNHGRPEAHTCDFRARNLEAIQEQIDNPITLKDIQAALDNR